VSSTAEETGAATSGTGSGLLEFLSWTIRKNELVDATASALRTGCQKVLSVEDDPGAVDLRAVDIDNVIGRFRNRNRLEMKERTLDQYEQRFRQSVDMYIKWLDDDPTWKPAQRKRTPGTSSGSIGPRTTEKNPVRTNDQVVTPRTPTIDDHPHQPGMITYPFPIRPGLQGKISLPEDLTTREAKRIGAFLTALAVEEDPAPRAITPPHSPDEE
jgi:hypothetical protein